MRTLAQNHKATRLNDRRLLARDLPERVTQNTRMVEADARDRDGNGISRARGVPAPAQADLEHRHVNAGLREHHHRRHGQQVERRDRVGWLPGGDAMRVHPTTRLSRDGHAMCEL